MQDPCAMSARALAIAIARGETSAETVTAAHLERIADREPNVQAFAHRSAEQALAEARQKRPLDSRCDPPFDGQVLAADGGFRAAGIGLPALRTKA